MNYDCNTYCVGVICKHVNQTLYKLIHTHKELDFHLSIVKSVVNKIILLYNYVSFCNVLGIFYLLCLKLSFFVLCACAKFCVAITMMQRLGCN